MSHTYDFFTSFARILNSGQSRSVVLCGNVYDLFWDGKSYVPLIPFLCKKAQAGWVKNKHYIVAPEDHVLVGTQPHDLTSSVPFSVVILISE